MNWIGAAIGGVLGFARGRYLGCLFGAALGYWIEMQVRGRAKPAEKRRPADAPPPVPPCDPYATLGTSRSASDEDLRAAYREKAKRLHPDVLRAQGLSDELMKLASEEMARVNAAWTAIKKERGI
jgi:DnaJ-domain-containing protein 1